MSNEPKIQNDKESNKMETIDTTQDDSIINDSPESPSKNILTKSKSKYLNFIFETPVSKIKNEPIMPSTPQKTQRTSKYEEFIEKGRNLMEIFEYL